MYSTSGDAPTLGMITRGDSLSGAVLSRDERYRYRLWREWTDLTCSPGGVEWTRVVVWIMLNPSTADHSADDPTVRRCANLACLWGATRIEVLNLFAYRATDPTALRRVDDPIGPDNDAMLRAVALHWINRANCATTVVCGWGAHGALHGRAEVVRSLLEGLDIPLHYLRLGKTGQPWHPLYLPNSIQPTLWQR